LNDLPVERHLENWAEALPQVENRRTDIRFAAGGAKSLTRAARAKFHCGIPPRQLT